MGQTSVLKNLGYMQSVVLDLVDEKEKASTLIVHLNK